MPDGGPCERVISLFLLFLQEIISGRPRLRRRNSGVPAARRRKKQRVSPQEFAPRLQRAPRHRHACTRRCAIVARHAREHAADNVISVV